MFTTVTVGKKVLLMTAIAPSSVVGCIS